MYLWVAPPLAFHLVPYPTRVSSGGHCIKAMLSDGHSGRHLCDSLQRWKLSENRVTHLSQPVFRVVRKRLILAVGLSSAYGKEAESVPPVELPPAEALKRVLPPVFSARQGRRHP